MKRFLVMMLCAAFCLTAAASVSAAIPTVSEDDKVDIMVIAREDFDEMTTETMNRSGSAAAVNASGGFASLDNLDSSIENGALKVNLSKAFFDFQFENVGTFPKVSEDAIFSMKVMPTSDNFSTSNLLVWGRNGNFEDVHSKIVNRKLIVKSYGSDRSHRSFFKYFSDFYIGDFHFCYSLGTIFKVTIIVYTNIVKAIQTKINFSVKNRG